jgi:hypothetical protein
MKPYEQGALDGLCAVYSIVNAARIISGIDEEGSRELFKEIMCFTWREPMTWLRSSQRGSA